MLLPLKLFRLEFFGHAPDAHDALCRAEERILRDSGAFDHLGFEKRREAIADAVRDRLPWAGARSGWVQTEFRDGRFYADLFVLGDAKRPKYRESFDLGSINDDAALLREAFMALSETVRPHLPAGAFLDEEPYHILVERFDFRRFCTDHRRPAPASIADRARKWN